MTAYLQLEALRATPLVDDPFPRLMVPGFVSAAGVAAISADYANVSSPGSLLTDQLVFHPA
jgi:SM-20-related protein